MGSTLGFRKVIGVEYSPFAHNIAQDNLKAFRPAGAKAGECVFINADAADFKLPSEGSLTLFFNNPFGLEVWKRVLPNISARRKQCPGDVRIILVGSMPEMLEPVAHFISQSKDFEQVKKGVSPMFADSYSRFHYWVFEAS
jgi:23S rRNA G2445 N2-methylase RlmL